MTTTKSRDGKTGGVLEARTWQNSGGSQTGRQGHGRAQRLCASVHLIEQDVSPRGARDSAVVLGPRPTSGWGGLGGWMYGRLDPTPPAICAKVAARDTPAACKRRAGPSIAAAATPSCIDKSRLHMPSATSRPRQRRPDRPATPWWRIRLRAPSTDLSPRGEPRILSSTLLRQRARLLCWSRTPRRDWPAGPSA